MVRGRKKGVGWLVGERGGWGWGRREGLERSNVRAKMETPSALHGIRPGALPPETFFFRTGV